MEDLFKSLSQFITLSPESRSAFSSILIRKEMKKGEILLKAEKTCNHIYYIEKGLTRTFYLKDGKDVTDWISTEQNFSFSILSFITRKPDRRSIELLEDSVLWSIHYDDLQKLYKEYHEIERLGRLLADQGLMQIQQRFDDLHFTSAQDRYKKLLLANPTIIQRVPLGMVASYLGISQETLSRIRSGLSF
jgi:CRP-like cAMP-binding protein